MALMSSFRFPCQSLAKLLGCVPQTNLLQPTCMQVDGAEVDRFEVPYHYADGPSNALQDPEGSTLSDEAALLTTDSHQQRALAFWGHHHNPGHSGHNYCVPEEGEFCNNCVGDRCRSADRKGADANICRFPER
eukprot:scaffold101555_cov20-Tisochrysis_lutea.AAC.2